MGEKNLGKYCFRSIPGILLASGLILAVGCGKKTPAPTPAAPAGNATVKYAPLSPTSTTLMSEGTELTATVATFKTLQLCNDTLVITDTNGNTVNPEKTGLGILNFSNTATTATALTSLNIATGTQIKEIDITSAGNSPTCAAMGANAVVFDPGNGAINITQNTAFKFVYATPLVITGSAQSLTLMFGAIVNAMVAQGAGLNNSTIQTIAVAGVAQ